jgi:hypothetical protein
VTDAALPWCPRCGNNQSSDRLCRGCWQGRADAQRARALADSALAGDSDAAQVLGLLPDPRAADALADVVSRDDGRLRLAAIKSLGWSGSAHHVPALLPALDAEGFNTRVAARGALADIGGSEAADALAASLDRIDDECERVGVIEALSWLRDPRAREGARRWFRHPVDEEYRQLMWSRALIHNSPDWMWPRVLTTDERDAFIEEALAAVPAADYRNFIHQDEATQRATQLVGHAHTMLSEMDPSQADAFREQLATRAGDGIERFPNAMRPPRLRQAAPEPEPFGERVVPKLGIAALSATPPPAGPMPPAKFGGQPDWIMEPQWPVSPHGKPLTFHGQLPVPGHPGQMAYVFFAGSGDELSGEPLSEGSAVVVQPAGTCHLSTTPLRSGPGIWRVVEEPGHFTRLWGIRECHEVYAVLQEGHDPLVYEYPPWDHDALRLPIDATTPGDRTDLNKIGGTPNWLQGDDTPAGDGWRFAFQWTAGWASDELADGAEIYGFINDHDLRACVLWQCH